MNLTISKVKAVTKDALKAQSINAQVVGAEWIGRKSPMRGGGEFRVARVTIETQDGRAVRKLVDIDTWGGYRIA